MRVVLCAVGSESRCVVFEKCRADDDDDAVGV